MAKRKYRVAGEFPVCGHKQGETFEHDFGDQEVVLLEGGHIVAVKGGKADAAEPDKTKEV